VNWKKFVSEARKEGETTTLYTSDNIEDLMDFSIKKMKEGWIVELQMPKVIKLKKNWKPQDILADACSRIKPDKTNRKIPYTKDDFEKANNQGKPLL